MVWSVNWSTRNVLCLKETRTEWNRTVNEVNKSQMKPGELVIVQNKHDRCLAHVYSIQKSLFKPFLYQKQSHWCNMVPVAVPYMVLELKFQFWTARVHNSLQPVSIHQVKVKLHMRVPMVLILRFHGLFQPTAKKHSLRKGLCGSRSTYDP
jgi:hypothetical protein